MRWFLAGAVFGTILQAHAVDLDFSGSRFIDRYLIKKLEPEAIKSFRDPLFMPLSEARRAGKLFYLDDDDWLVVVKRKGEIKLYPYPPLVWHEVVNDQFGGEPVGVTYCILTGSVVVFRSEANNRKRTFGVSGMLYMSNLVMYDYQTGSLWPQLAWSAYSGIERDSTLELLPFSLVRYSYAKEKYRKEAILIGSRRLEPLQRMYDRRPTPLLDDYEHNDAIRSEVPEECLNDPSFPLKEPFLYFLKENRAIPYSSLKAMGADRVDVVWEKDRIVAIHPKPGVSFVNMYWFALKAYYPEAAVLLPANPSFGKRLE